MFLSIPSMWSRPDRVRQSLPALFGNDPQTYRSDFTERKVGVPQLLLVEQPVKGSSVLPHYHGTDQFQVFIDGSGKLGRQEIKPVSVHYTNRYTGYGPIVAGEEGISYYVLRPEFDQLITGQYLHFPEKREALKQHKTHRRSEIVDGVRVRTEKELLQFRAPATERLIDAESDPRDAGLFAEVLLMGSNLQYTGPEPGRGGGQVFFVLQGALLYNSETYSQRSSLVLTREEKAITFNSGESGLQALVLQYPKRND